MPGSGTADKIAEAARLLHDADRLGRPIATPPAELEPADDAAAWAVHQAVVANRGAVAGWKVGAAAPDAEPGVGQITADTLFASPARRPAFRLGAVEAEIAVTFGKDLPARDAPYSLAEVLDAIATWRPAIEALETRFADWAATPPLWKVADRQNHGALVLGPGRSRMPTIPLARLPVRLLIDEEVIFAHEGGNTGGDPARLLVHLANRQRGSSRPLRAGDVVTTGSTTPFLRAAAGQTVRAEFAELGAAELTFEP